MASSSKKKTTFAKLNREAAVRERRLRKQAKKEARKLEASAPPSEPELLDADADDAAEVEGTVDVDAPDAPDAPAPEH